MLLATGWQWRLLLQSLFISFLNIVTETWTTFETISVFCKYFVLRNNCIIHFFPTEIGDIAGVADVTIRQSYRLIYPKAADLFPPDFKFDTPVDKLPQL